MIAFDIPGWLNWLTALIFWRQASETARSADVHCGMTVTRTRTYLGGLITITTWARTEPDEEREPRPPEFSEAKRVENQCQ